MLFRRCVSAIRGLWSLTAPWTKPRPVVIIAVPIEKGGAVIARIDGAAINELFDSIELSQQGIISVLDSDGRILYRRRGSEAPSEADVSWAPLSSVLTSDRTNVVELTSPDRWCKAGVWSRPRQRNWPDRDDWNPSASLYAGTSSFDSLYPNWTGRFAAGSWSGSGN